MPDLSLNADFGLSPENIFLNGSLQGNGGTSIVAPELAGFFAQENSYLMTIGKGPLGNPDAGIYRAITGNVFTAAPHDPFYDVIGGCTNGGTGNCAVSGYDLATGLGSANMLQLAWALNWFSFDEDGAPVVTFSGPATGAWYNTDQSVSLTIVASPTATPTKTAMPKPTATKTPTPKPTATRTPISPIKTPTPKPTATKTPVLPTKTPTPRPTPRLSVTPSSAHAGSSVTVAGTGFVAHEAVTLKYNRGQPACTSTTVLATSSTDGRGAFSVAVTLPSSTHTGVHALAAFGGMSGDFASTTVTIT